MRNSLPLFFVFIQKPLPKAAAPPQSGSPSPALPTGRELIPAVFEAVGSSSFPLDKVGMELRTKAMYGWLIVDGVHPDNAGEVALSRRRYPHQLNASVITADNPHHDSHRHGFLCFHSSNDNQSLNPFFYAHLHTFCPKSVEV